MLMSRKSRPSLVCLSRPTLTTSKVAPASRRAKRGTASRHRASRTASWITPCRWMVSRKWAPMAEGPMGMAATLGCGCWSGHGAAHFPGGNWRAGHEDDPVHFRDGARAKGEIYGAEQPCVEGPSALSSIPADPLPYVFDRRSGTQRRGRRYLPTMPPYIAETPRISPLPVRYAFAVC